MNGFSFALTGFAAGNLLVRILFGSTPDRFGRAKNWGRIIFVSSESAVFIPTEKIHYGMTKIAQIAVARGLAELTKGTEVTVNTILPGPTKSKGVGGFIEDLARHGNTDTEQVEKEFFSEYASDFAHQPLCKR